MAVALPLVFTVMSYGGVAATVAAATTSVLGFLQVGGAVLSAVGGLTKKKDLARLGTLMSLGAGVANLASSASSASSAAQAGSGASSAADSAATASWGGEAFSPSSALTEATQAASPALTTMADGATDMAGTGAAEVARPTSIMDVATGGIASPTGVAAPPSAAWGGEAMSPASLMDQSGWPQPAQTVAGQAARTPTPANVLQKQVVDEGLTLDTIKRFGSGAAKGIRENPELAKFGFKILEGMYGPQAMAAEEQDRLIRRRRENLNNPIRLTIGAQGG